MTDLFDLPFEEEDDVVVSHESLVVGPESRPTTKDQRLTTNDQRPTTPAAPARRVFSVTELTVRVRDLLEAEFFEVWVEGELSNCRVWNTGHLYFTLKDGASQIKAVIFRSALRYLKFKPADGLRVVARGRVSVYEPKGEYQLVCEHLEPHGLGALQLAFDQLKKRLQDEGLFDAARKRALPALPRKIGIVTSLDGAAVRDIINVLRRRYANAHLVICPARVQGEDAAPDIARALRQIARVPGVDVVIVGRGGGSIEDLWAFNEEIVARAIAKVPVPVISAVGHETDVTIADFVADLRAPTPSAAAELISRNQLELLRQIQSQQQRLEMAMDYYLAQLAQRFSRLNHRLQQQHPHLRLARQQTALLKLRRRLDEAMQNQLRQMLCRADRLQQRLTQQQPQPRIHRAQQRVQQLQYRLQQAMSEQLGEHRERFGKACAQLEGVSPLARGYSVTTTPQGALLKKTTQTAPGDTLKTRLADGWIESEVKSIVVEKKARKRAVKGA